jgi:hypothetical protein
MDFMEEFYEQRKQLRASAKTKKQIALGCR